ncbi:hypothetical protein JYU34_003072 [Plutella xylostella]|uniref:Reverse transcriptase n=1 Tax=Plutella xylostella TaxID=51655 RepID=A0ABQ7QZ37_PLUXY|nr:hypothetical protein JYU34_003072 [Plutella xylostella]
METEIIKRAHEIGHFGKKKTMDIIDKDYYIKDLAKKIDRVILGCVPCILASKKEGKQEGFLSPIDKGELPLETLHIDHLGPLDATKKMYNYILTVVDAFTKFVWIYPTKTLTAKETVEKLRLHQKDYGNPTRYITDKGAAFTGREFNCLSNGIFPRCLKKSIIHPIHKSGDRDRVENYRPISILPSISKLLERIINTRLINYLESNNLLSNCQFGFRTGKSTDDAVHKLTDYIARNLDKGQKTCGIFLDLAKAFDTVSVPILLNKLHNIGIRGTQLKLFEDYLSERSQRVQINEYISCDLTVRYGVPQGSILGPILFLVYINDLLSLSLPHGKIFSYADDTVLLFSTNTWEETFERAQYGFNQVSQWLRLHLLTLNESKTKYITFSIRNSNQPPSNFKIISHTCDTHNTCSCNALSRTSKIKYLGVMLDQNLCFKDHIDLTTTRVRKLIFIFKKLRHILDPILLKRIYIALVQSVLTYCITSWGGAPKTSLLSLERAQRAILKVSNFRQILYPTEKLYQDCQVLTVRQLFLYQITLKQHALIFNSLDPNKTLRRLDKVCKTFTFKHSFMRHYFCYVGPDIYNKLNKLNKLHLLNKHECKAVIFKFLQKLNYVETENLLKNSY